MNVPGVTPEQKKRIGKDIDDIWHGKAWDHLKRNLGIMWAEDARLEGGDDVDGPLKGKSLCDLLGYGSDDFSYIAGNLNTDEKNPDSDSRGGWYVLEQSPPSFWGDTSQEDLLKEKLEQKIAKTLFSSPQVAASDVALSSDEQAQATAMADALMTRFTERQGKAALWMFIKVLNSGDI